VVTTQFTRKAGDLRHVLLTLTQNYEYPIRTRAMRPARDSCETCHFPEKFSDDSLREINDFEGEANSAQSTYLIMKTGGGSEREGLGRGIHWHIENEVYFLATDDLQQDIPYVRVVDRDGKVSEYYDVGSGYTPDLIAGTKLEQMDCITCHNRVTHTIPKPDEAVDEALKKGLLPAELPFIREQALGALGHLYVTDEEGAQAIADVGVFYEENYPELYAEREEDIEGALNRLRELYAQMVFREQRIDWTTHPDNLGHRDDPGCFRCHDGKHLTPSGEAIRLECNLCHSIPVIVDETDLVTELEVVSGPVPPSHTHSNWMTLHGKAIDSSCAACHIPEDPLMDYTELEDKPPADKSFCGNEACHGTNWRYTGFDTPTLSLILDRQLFILQNMSPFLLEDMPRTYDDTFATLFDGRCVSCHSGPNTEADLDLSSYKAMLQGGKNGPALVPGDPANSLIIRRQSEAKEHFGQVLDDELEALEAWIAAGAPEQ
jgi:mono/diheme cytochrome c family protein